MEEDFLEPEDSFEERFRLCLDPYYDREFFTNLIHCMDRGKSLRELFSKAVKELEESGTYNEDVDRGLTHLFYSYQAAQYLREEYQALPLAQGLYSLALFRGEAKSPLEPSQRSEIGPSAVHLDQFVPLLKLEARRVSSYEKAWAGFQFLLEGRSTRADLLDFFVSSLLYEADKDTVFLCMRAIDASFATAWKQSNLLLKRAFQRFWEEGKDLEVSPFYESALVLERSRSLVAQKSKLPEWEEEWAENIWHRASSQSLESAWEAFHELIAKGVSLEQLSVALILLRGRLLFGMKKEQWPLVTQSLIFADSLRSAMRWCPQKQSLYIAMSLAEFVRTAQIVNPEINQRPSGDKVLESLSPNLGKNQLVLRMDDACERGDAEHALKLLSCIVEEKGLAHSVSDRLVLMASKQDAWTYDFSSIPSALILTQAYEQAVRLKMQSRLTSDALYGLLRYFSDQRADSLQEVRKSGGYGDGGLKLSTFDVSDGARIVDRFVFNQMRNAQRIFIWPTEGKG